MQRRSRRLHRARMMESRLFRQHRSQMLNTGGAPSAAWPSCSATPRSGAPAHPARPLPSQGQAIDDTEGRVHGGQQLTLWNAHYDSRCFLPIHTYEAASGKPVAVILRPGKTPDGTEVTLVLRHVIGRIRAGWPAVEIIMRGDSHYGRPEPMAWCERQRVGYISAWPAARCCCASRPACRGHRPRSPRRRVRQGPALRRLGPSSAASSPASRPAPKGPTAASSSRFSACPLA